MIIVIFEVWPKEGERDAYFDIAAALRPTLETIAGFISIERFESLAEPGKILSLSFFGDEESVRIWRNLEPYRKAAMEYSRTIVFVSPVCYAIVECVQAPDDSKKTHDAI